MMQQEQRKTLRTLLASLQTSELSSADCNALRNRLQVLTEQLTSGVVWAPVSEPQALAYQSEAFETLYGGSAGGGKASRISSLVLTPFGWKPIGDLRLGSKICGTDGTVSEVIGIYPQGEQDIYRVTMRDGGSCEVTLDHIWLAWPTHSQVKKGNVRTNGITSRRLYTTGSLIRGMRDKIRKDGRVRGFAIPITSPVVFNVAGSLVGPGNFIGLPIDPYLLGVLIGDGCIAGGDTPLAISSADEEILGYVNALAQGGCAIDDTSSLAKSVRFRGEFLVQLKKALADLGLLGKRAGDKAIPRQYLMGPGNVRWALLQGLMDTDGWVEPGRACYYTTISKQLSDDVVFLARSLGAVTSVSEKIPSYTHKGKKRHGQVAYCIRIRISDASRCFRLERKKVVAAEIQHQSEGRFITDIQFSCRDEAVCIKVSNPNSLYITDDFIVTHNSDLLLGLACTAHRKSIIFRREFGQIKDLLERSREILVGTPARYNNVDHIWRNIPGSRTLEFGSVQYEDDKLKYKGRPHDLKEFDELTEFNESQYKFLIGWARTTIPGQAVRVISSTNPPTNRDGEWVIRHWAPWLDRHHPHPAAPGELRWFAMVDGNEVERPDGQPFQHKNELIHPRSRTFFPARVTDNPYLMQTGYYQTLQSMPEPLRSQLLYGDFSIGLDDDPWQVIPTEWVRLAQERWKEVGKLGLSLSALGVDPARGGSNKTILAPRYSNWFGPLQKHAGESTPNGPRVAALIAQAIEGEAQVNLDVVGIGAAVFDSLPESANVYAVVSSEASEAKDRLKKFAFANVRSEMWWKFRESLDPYLGDNIALPPDPELMSDLCAPVFEVRLGKITVERKEKIIERLGRSPDCGDAVVMAAWQGKKRTKMFAHEAAQEIARQQIEESVQGKVDLKKINDVYEEIVVYQPTPPTQPEWSWEDLKNR